MENYCHKVQYYETDQMQIVHHSNYIRWFEEARTFYLEQIGFGYDRMEKEGITCPVVEVFCKYISMVRFPEKVLISSKIIEFTGVRMTLKYEIRDQVSGKLRTTGHSKHCFVGAAGKPVMLSKENQELFDLLKSHLSEESGIGKV
jgi:acyl-CoA thioester hydrolase